MQRVIGIVMCSVSLGTMLVVSLTYSIDATWKLKSGIVLGAGFIGLCWGIGLLVVDAAASRGRRSPANRPSR